MNLSILIENLEARGYQVSVFQTALEASEYLDKQIDKKTIGIGGCMSVKEMNLYQKLSKHNKIHWHWQPMDGLNVEDERRAAMNTDIYISSVNAISMSGELVNIDGYGNRVASTLYGHNKVYFIIGTNKIADSLDAAINRARNTAAPLNCKRLGLKTPCATNADKCYDCKGSTRSCNAMVIHYMKMGSCDMEIILVKEKLGF